jgi:UDP-glucose 4-epimerase
MALAERIVATTGSSSPIVTVPYDEAYERGVEDLARRLPDIAKIRAAVGWRPRRGLADVLDDVIAHERARAAVS